MQPVKIMGDINSSVLVGDVLSPLQPPRKKWCRYRAVLKVRYYLSMFLKKNMSKMSSTFFYSLQGPDALKFQYDSSGSGVPDSIKDIAVQLQAAKYLYSTVLGLRFPLQQKNLRTGAANQHLCADFTKR